VSPERPPEAVAFANQILDCLKAFVHAAPEDEGPYRQSLIEFLMPMAPDPPPDAP